MDLGTALDLAIEDFLSRNPLACDDFGVNGQVVVAGSQRVVRPIGQRVTIQADDLAGDYDIRVIARAQMVGAIALKLFAERGRGSLAQPRLDGLVGKGNDLDRLFAGAQAVRRAEGVTGATRTIQCQHEAPQQDEPAPVIPWFASGSHRFFRVQAPHTWSSGLY